MPSVALRTARHSIPEFALIRALTRRFAARRAGVIRGIGDDAAVLAPARGEWWHLTTDVLVEGIHFDLNSASLESVGYRAGMANLSDLAAMGAEPRYLLVSLAIPPALASRRLYACYRGLMRACRKHGVTLIGGDTSASRSDVFLSIALIGVTPIGRALFRRGATPGDLIYVTGTLGDSLAGLQLLAHTRRGAHGRRRTSAWRSRHRRYLIERHLHPTARVAEGQWLNRARLATAAIDVSDGLSGDLRHLCEESRTGAEILARALPVSDACRSYAEWAGKDPTALALAGGEDYELLFTVAPADRAQVEREARSRGFSVTCIGAMQPSRFGLRLRTGTGRLQPLPFGSYEHFRS